MDDVEINEFSSVEHWEMPLCIVVARTSVRIQDRRRYTIAAVSTPAWWDAEQKSRVGNATMTMLELRHANWEASL